MCPDSKALVCRPCELRSRTDQPSGNCAKMSVGWGDPPVGSTLKPSAVASEIPSRTAVVDGATSSGAWCLRRSRRPARSATSGRPCRRSAVRRCSSPARRRRRPSNTRPSRCRHPRWNRRWCARRRLRGPGRRWEAIVLGTALRHRCRRSRSLRRPRRRARSCVAGSGVPRGRSGVGRMRVGRRDGVEETLPHVRRWVDGSRVRHRRHGFADLADLSQKCRSDVGVGLRQAGFDRATFIVGDSIQGVHSGEIEQVVFVVEAGSCAIRHRCSPPDSSSGGAGRP